MISHTHVRANGLRHHVLDAAPDAGVPTRETVVLLHGYLDLAESFEAVIVGLNARGYRVIAPDFRGHGDTDPVPDGGYYHFPDYVSDLWGLFEALSLAKPHVVAHSMGGSVATMFSGAFPSRVRSLSLLEGVGPFAMPADIAPDRMVSWIQGVAKMRARTRRAMASLDEVVARMRTSHPSVSREVLERMAARAVRTLDDGSYAFKFDPMHQTTSPGRFDEEGFCAFIDRVECPVMLLDGGEITLFENLVERSRRFKNAARVSLDGAGHMMHWTRPDALTAAIAGFLRDAEGEARP